MAWSASLDAANVGLQSGERSDYGRSASGFQTVKSILIGSAKQGRLLTAGSLLGFDGGNRGHVENAAGGHRWREDMRRPRRADQDRPNWQRVRKHLDHLIGAVGGIEVRYDQDVCLTMRLWVWQDQLPRCFRQRGIALHFAVRLDFRMVLLEERRGTAHLARGVGIITAEVGM